MKNKQGLTKAYIEGRKAQDARLHAEDLKGSTASKAKALEPMVRNYCLVNGIQRAEDVKSRPGGTPDAQVWISGGGRKVVLEVKSRSGAVRYAEDHLFTAEDYTEDNVLPAADYIAYAIDASYVTDENVMRLVYVFTREEFIGLLKYMFRGCKTRPTYGTIIPALNVTKHGGQLNIQNISDKPERLYYEYLEEFNPMTLERFSKEILGR